MVCRLPPKMLQAIERYRYCYQTEPVVGTRTRSSTKYYGFGRPLKECEDGLKRDMGKLGASHFSAGVHRRVFGFRFGKDSCVVKVARTPDQGTEANRQETKAWRILPPRAKRYFAPVTDADPEGWWEVMPEVETSGGDEYDVEERLSSVGVRCADLHSANIGYYRGEPVAIDYGYFGFKCRPSFPSKLAAERAKGLEGRPLGQRSLLQFGRRHR